MASNTFGTSTDPSHYAEIPDPSAAGQVIRPTAGATIWVRDYATQIRQADIITLIYGYLPTFSLQNIPTIEVSGDGGTTWVGPLVSAEARAAAATAGADAASAVQLATSASTTAQQALQLAQQAGQVTIDGSTGTNFTLAQIHARDTRVQVPPGDVLGLDPVATSGLGADLNDLGLPNGIVPLDAAGKIAAIYLPAGGTAGGVIEILQNADGTWPVRTTKTADVTQRVYYDPRYDPTKLPSIGVDLATAKAANPGSNIPGDVLYNKGVV